MDLPVRPPLKPMLARASATIPPGMSYEAKWDGFRALLFRDRDEVEIGSRTGKSLLRYFPELADAARAQLPERCVLDGEITVVRGPRLDFEALQQRIHPAASRVRLLAERTPASYVAFDLLALGDSSLLAAPFKERRAALLRVLGGGTRGPFHAAPATDDLDLARHWFEQFEGAGIDGIVAKDPEAPYRPDERRMVKIKHERTADCVVAGVRPHKDGAGVGSLMLGLHDEAGVLQYVGVCSSFAARRRRELLEELRPLFEPDPVAAGHPWASWRSAEAHEDNRLPGAPSRWSGGKDLSWTPLRPERVVEVAYDRMEGDRFRHTTRFRRWRPERNPASCTYAQLTGPVDYDLAQVLDGRAGA